MRLPVMCPAMGSEHTIGRLDRCWLCEWNVKETGPLDCLGLCRACRTWIERYG